MEEIINRLSKAVATYSFEATNYPNCIVFREDLENLINKYKELEETNNILSGVIKSLTKLGEEHMEMINLMAIQLAKRKSIMEKVCKECPYCDCIESKTKNCVIDYFKKKAKGE